MKIGQCIYLSRKKSGISQEELASKLEVSRQSISLWETDQTIPTLDKLQAMCKIFNVSMDELTGIKPFKNDINEEKQLLRKEEIKRQNEIALNRMEIGAFIVSLLTFIFYYLGIIGIFYCVISLILNVICLFNKRKRFVPYALVITIVFLFAAIFRVIYY